jgi:hypothetical protein
MYPWRLVLPKWLLKWNCLIKENIVTLICFPVTLSHTHGQHLPWYLHPQTHGHTACHGQLVLPPVCHPPLAFLVEAMLLNLLRVSSGVKSNKQKCPQKDISEKCGASPHFIITIYLNDSGALNFLWAGKVAQVVACLPSKLKDLSSRPSTKSKTKKQPMC